MRFYRLLICMNGARLGNGKAQPEYDILINMFRRRI
jgi:hypothetical protein